MGVYFPMAFNHLSQDYLSPFSVQAADSLNADSTATETVAE